MHSMRAIGTATAGLALLPAGAGAATERLAAAPGTPAAVREAAEQVVGVHSGGQDGRDGSAVFVGERGYVTPTLLVARATEIVLTRAGGSTTVADREQSTAPSGLELLSARDRTKGAGLTPRRLRGSGTTTVYVIRFARTGKNRSTILRTITRSSIRTSKRGLIELSSANRPGGAGGAVVDSAGRLVAITKPRDTGDNPAGARQQALAISDVPAVTQSASSGDDRGFPAVPGTIGLGLLLLLSQLGLSWRQRRDVGQPAAPALMATTTASAQNAPGPADDLEITFRPRS